MYAIRSYYDVGAQTSKNTWKRLQKAGPVFAGCGTAAAADGPLPVGDIGGLTVAGAMVLGSAIGGVIYVE